MHRHDPYSPKYFANYTCADLGRKIKGTTSKINSQFSDLQSLPYHLHSVIIHRGMVSSGHYWIYTYDFERKVWRKYNDGYVTEVKDTKEIFETEDSTRPATSSFLVYVKDGLEKELTDAVCRNIVPEAAGSGNIIQLDGAGGDAPMLNGGGDSPMEKLARWSTDLGAAGDGEKKGAGKGLARKAQIPGHSGVTW